MNKPLVIFAGYFARYPLGGHVLAELSCLIGLQKLGFDVVFVEGCGKEESPFFDLKLGDMSNDPANGIAAMRTEFRRFGLEDRWCLIDPAGAAHGIDRGTLAELCRESAFLFSRAGTSWTEEFRLCRKRIYLDVDPGFTQFRLSATPVASVPGYASPYDFDQHFTLAGRIGMPGCTIPSRGLNWKPTRPPFVPDLVPETGPAEPGSLFTTVMSWNAYGEAEFDGQIYGQKNREFGLIENLPQTVSETAFGIAMASAPREVSARLRSLGWTLAKPSEVTGDLHAYLRYLTSARGEISVAKHGYVKSRGGWFSDRTVAFLGCGRPAIVQDTGFAELLPTGTALFAFEDSAGAAAAVRAVESGYADHCAAARAFAEEHFGYKKVLGSLLQEAGVELPSWLDAGADLP